MLGLRIADSALFSFSLKQVEGFHLGKQDTNLPIGHNAGQGSFISAFNLRMSQESFSSLNPPNKSLGVKAQ